MFFYYLKLMIQLLLSPKHGWEDIAYDDPSLRKLMVSGFVPWLVIAAATALVPFVYRDDYNVLMMIIAVMIMFLKYFVTYFIAGFLFQMFIPYLSKGAYNEKNCNTLIMMSIGLLALIGIIKNCVPVDMPVVNFFPLYVLLIMWRGNRFVKVPKINGWRYTALCFMSALLPPYLLQGLFNLILH